VPLPPPPLTMTYPHPENDVLPNGINRSFDLFCFVLQQKEGRVQHWNRKNTEE
jgi:hypothetical protein